MIYVAARRRDINRLVLLISRKAHPVTKPPIITPSASEVKDQFTSGDDKIDESSASKSLNLKSFSDLTKFKLSQYNTLAAFSTYLYYSQTLMLYDSLIFLTATQLISMSSQAYNQVVESEYDKNMRRTQNRPVAKNIISKQTGGFISAGLALCSVGLYTQLANPSAMFVASSVWILY